MMYKQREGTAEKHIHLPVVGESTVRGKGMLMSNAEGEGIQSKPVD